MQETFGEGVSDATFYNSRKVFRSKQLTAGAVRVEEKVVPAVQAAQDNNGEANAEATVAPVVSSGAPLATLRLPTFRGFAPS
jgi:hypothetical protein